MAILFLGHFSFAEESPCCHPEESSTSQDARSKHFLLKTDELYSKLTDKVSLRLALFGVWAVVLTRQYDDSIRVQYMDNQLMSESDSHIGDLLGTGIPGFAVAMTQYYLDKENGEAHLRALLSTGLSTYAMKYSFGRKRPGTSKDYRAFPSGHTSTTFASATSLAYAYGWKAAVPAYALATFTGFSRLADDAHWASDIVGGAFVGIIFARASYYFSGSEKNQSLSLLPIYSDEFKGLTFNFNY